MQTEDIKRAYQDAVTRNERLDGNGKVPTIKEFIESNDMQRPLLNWLSKSMMLENQIDEDRAGRILNELSEHDGSYSFLTDDDWEFIYDTAMRTREDPKYKPEYAERGDPRNLLDIDNDILSNSYTKYLDDSYSEKAIVQDKNEEQFAEEYKKETGKTVGADRDPEAFKDYMRWMKKNHPSYYDDYYNGTLEDDYDSEGNLVDINGNRVPSARVQAERPEQTATAQTEQPAQTESQPMQPSAPVQEQPAPAQTVAPSSQTVTAPVEQPAQTTTTSEPVAQPAQTVAQPQKQEVQPAEPIVQPAQQVAPTNQQAAEPVRQVGQPAQSAQPETTVQKTAPAVETAPVQQEQPVVEQTTPAATGEVEQPAPVKETTQETPQTPVEQSAPVAEQSAPAAEPTLAAEPAPATTPSPAPAPTAVSTPTQTTVQPAATTWASTRKTATRSGSPSSISGIYGQHAAGLELAGLASANGISSAGAQYYSESASANEEYNKNFEKALELYRNAQDERNKSFADVIFATNQELNGAREEAVRDVQGDRKAARWTGATELASAIANMIAVGEGNAVSQTYNNYSQGWMQKADQDARLHRARIDSIRDRQRTLQQQLLQLKMGDAATALTQSLRRAEAQREARIQKAGVQYKTAVDTMNTLYKSTKEAGEARLKGETKEAEMRWRSEENQKNRNARGRGTGKTDTGKTGKTGKGKETSGNGSGGSDQKNKSIYDEVTNS